jgi:hypothetical protein
MKKWAPNELVLNANPYSNNKGLRVEVNDLADSV